MTIAKNESLRSRIKWESILEPMVSVVRLESL